MRFIFFRCNNIDEWKNLQQNVHEDKHISAVSTNLMCWQIWMRAIKMKHSDENLCEALSLSAGLFYPWLCVKSIFLVNPWKIQRDELSSKNNSSASWIGMDKLWARAFKISAVKIPKVRVTVIQTNSSRQIKQDRLSSSRIQLMYNHGIRFEITLQNTRICFHNKIKPFSENHSP